MKSNDNLTKINFNKEGITLDNSLPSQIHFIKWSSIDTIIFGGEKIYHDHSEFIVYLNKSASITLGKNASWFSKLFFYLSFKRGKKLRIYDTWNRDFPKFIEGIKPYLKNVNDVDVADDRKGTLIKRTTSKKKDKITVTERWKPKANEEFPWKMVYDKYNRTAQEIYKKNGGI